MKEQFGQEYKDPKDFKKEFRQALRQVKAVYPDAHIEEVVGGLLLKPSPPPIAKKMVQVLQPSNPKEALQEAPRKIRKPTEKAKKI